MLYCNNLFYFLVGLKGWIKFAAVRPCGDFAAHPTQVPLIFSTNQRYLWLFSYYCTGAGVYVNCGLQER